MIPFIKLLAMKIMLSILSQLIFVFASGVFSPERNMQSETVPVWKETFKRDTALMLNPIPKELIVTQPVNDSDVVVYKSRCVVQTEYSSGELAEVEKKQMTPAEWKVYYEDYKADNGVSMFICERAMVYIESDKKYIQFLMSDGVKITVDRKKSIRRLFFFNPKTGVKQCLSVDFKREKYKPF
jgi:hypothetical protein